MHASLRNASAAIALLSAVALPAPANALLIDSREIALFMESTIVDLDTSAIAVHFGPSIGSELSYVSRIDETGWQGRLFGTYGSRAVDIYYTGTLSFVGGPLSRYDISYTSAWLLDGQTGVGSGTGVYTDPDFDFDIDLTNLSVSGSVSVSYGIATLSIGGSKSLLEHKMTASASASVLDLPLIGNLAEVELSFELDQLTGEYGSTMSVSVGGGWIYEHTDTINGGTLRRPPPTPDPPPPPPPRYPADPPRLPYPPGGSTGGFDPTGGPGYGNMRVYSVAAPAPLLLLAAPVLLLAYRRRRAAVAARSR